MDANRDHQPDTPPAAAEDSAGARRLTWDAAAGLREVWVPIGYLPRGVAFGDDFPAPIRHDAQQQRLWYRGHMTHARYQFLRGLSADLPYQLAIDRLFVASAPVAEPSSGRSRFWLAVAGGAAVAALVLAGAIWLSAPGPAGPEPLDDLLELLDDDEEDDVMVDADPDDLVDPAASPAAAEPDAASDVDVGSG